MFEIDQKAADRLAKCIVFASESNNRAMLDSLLKQLVTLLQEEGKLWTDGPNMDFYGVFTHNGEKYMDFGIIFHKRRYFCTDDDCTALIISDDNPEVLHYGPLKDHEHTFQTNTKGTRPLEGEWVSHS